MSRQAYSYLLVWQKSIALVVEVYRLTKMFPSDEHFGIVAQIRRAAVSVPCNIAEGHGRATRGEYLNHLSVANGSLSEVHTLAHISRELAFAPATELERITEKVEELLRMMAGLQRSLRHRR